MNLIYFDVVLLNKTKLNKNHVIKSEIHNIMIVTKHTQRRYSHNNKKIYKMQQNKNIGKTEEEKILGYTLIKLDIATDKKHCV